MKPFENNETKKNDHLFDQQDPKNNTDPIAGFPKNNDDKKRRKGVILIADGETEIREIIKEFLEMEGFIVYEAEDGEAAFNIFEKNKYDIDIIIIEIQMPKMNGEQLINKIMSVNREANIIVISSHIRHKVAINPQKYGVSAFLPKPFDLRELIERINLLLNGG